MSGFQQKVVAGVPTSELSREVLRHMLFLMTEESAEPSGRYSVLRALRETLNPEGLTAGVEADVCKRVAASIEQQMSPHRVFCPWSALTTRDLSAAIAPAGGYVVDTRTLPARDILRPWSVTLQSGLQVIEGLTSNITQPLAKTGATVVWSINEGLAPSAGADPTFAQVSMAAKLAYCTVKVGRNLFAQPAAAEFIGTLLTRAAAAAIDMAVLAGSGASGQPLGLKNTSGVGTVSGTSLAYAGLRSMRRQILDAGGREERISFIGAPDVQELLGGRELAAGGGRFLWDSDGVLGRPAHATSYAPAATLFAGDWSEAAVGLWGPPGFFVDSDPFTYFTAGIVQLRVVVAVDVGFMTTGAFSVASSLT